MKRLLLALVCISLCSFMAAADDGKTVVVKNSTGYDFYYLYVSPSNWDNWEDDLLMGNYLADGEQREFVLSSEYGDECIFDVRAIDLDDDSYSIYEVDICSNNMIEITMDNYDEDNYDSDYGYDRYDEGYQEGYSTGFRDAYADAYRQGYADGFSDGRALEE